MKILCISDETDPLIYSEHITTRYGDVDLVLSAGDLPLKYYEFIISMLNKPLYFVFGNHNQEYLHQYLSNNQSPSEAFHQQVVGLQPFGGEFVDGRVRYDKRNKLIIAGLGGSMRYNNGDHQFTDFQMFLRIMKMIPRMIFNQIVRGRYVDVLLTHAPPLGLGDGIDLPHKGFSSLLVFMKWFKPAYLLHGHVHLVDFNANRVHLFRQTKVINIFRNYLLEDDQLGGETDVQDGWRPARPDK